MACATATSNVCRCWKLTKIVVVSKSRIMRIWSTYSCASGGEGDSRRRAQWCAGLEATSRERSSLNVLGTYPDGLLRPRLAGRLSGIRRGVHGRLVVAQELQRPGWQRGGAIAAACRTRPSRVRVSPGAYARWRSASGQRARRCLPPGYRHSRQRRPWRPARAVVVDARAAPAIRRARERSGDRDRRRAR